MKTIGNALLGIAAAVLVVGCQQAAGVYEGGEITQVNVGPHDDRDDDGEDDDGLQTAKLGLYSLKAAKSCEEVTKLWRDKAVKLMEEQLASTKEMLLHPSVCYYDDWRWAEVMYADCAAAGDAGAAYSGEDDDEGGSGSGKNGDSASEYSTTNTQEVGVDEADYIKNDGAYIYILTGNLFQIIDAWPPEDAVTMSLTEIEGAPRKLYVHKDTAVIYSSIGGGYDYYYECTYGYDCEFTGDGSPLKITVLDITDVENPELIREIVFQGTYLNSRRVEDFVYTMVYHNEPPMPSYPSTPPELEQYVGNCVENEGDALDMPYDADDIEEMYEALRQQNLKEIDKLDIAAWIPSVEDTSYVNGEPVVGANPLADCSGYYMSQTDDGMSLLSLVSFDLTKADAAGPLVASTTVGRPGAVYASKQSLYVVSRHYKYEMEDYWFEEYETADETTTVHKFLMASDSPGTAYAGSGLVKGRVLNQFAMSEYNDHFRIATTTGHLPDPNTHNTVTVMKLKDGNLDIVGQLDNLAPGEDIRSARFSGDLGFIVTFKKTDPLFVIDLSDPTKPVVKGELKIPGFSTYMHFIDKSHILSIGYDADDMGDFAWFDGIMLQVFDVTDITNPTLMHKEVIGTRGTTSDAATNHLAFNFFKPKDLLAVPMVVCEGGGDGSFGETMTFNGLMLYNVTVENGFKYVGGVPHETAALDVPDDEYYYYDEYYSMCSSWWSDSSSTVKRSIFMEDFVYSVAMDMIKIASIDKPDLVLSSVALGK